ncbi:MAG TPA: hypothetical protein VN957_09240, partial [Chthoniobacterales bacterium]|nr:hypothetical protein [Chthoniobacterales bacterium]
PIGNSIRGGLCRFCASLRHEAYRRTDQRRPVGLLITINARSRGKDHAGSRRTLMMNIINSND